MKAISRSDDLRRENRRRVLAALRHGPARSRTALAAATGLSASTVTAVTSDLLDSGHLIEAEGEGAAAGPGKGTPRRGRPQVALARNPDVASFAVLTVTVNTIGAVLVDFAGRAICRHAVRRDMRSLDPAGFTAALRDLLEKTQALAPGPARPLSAIEVSVQGVVDIGGGRLHWSPLSDHLDLDIGPELAAHFGVPVTLTNDTNMIAIGLRSSEPERFRDTFAVIMMSYGIGMGLYTGGQLFSGTKTSGAEFGHMRHLAGGALCRCGRRGCVEAYASEYAIYRTARGLPQDELPGIEPGRGTMADIARAAHAGEPRARAAYTAAGEAIGQGLLNLFALFDPLPVAFVGSGTLGFDLMEPIIRATLGDSGPGLRADAVPMYSYADNLDMMYRGTVVSGLSKLDRAEERARA